MVKFCPECAYPITDKNAQFCSKCGTVLPITTPTTQDPSALSTEVQRPTKPSWYIPPASDVPTSTSAPTPTQPSQDLTTNSPKKKRSTFEWIAIYVGGLILLLIFSVVVAQFVYGIPGSPQKTTTTVPLTPTINPIVQIKNNAQNIPYDDLFRNNENYIGKTVYYRGKILQVLPVFGDTYNFRVATKSSQYLGYIEDIVYVNYKGSRFLEGDTIDLWAKVDGLKTYTAVLGNSVSVPELTALHTELVSKDADSTSIQPTATSQIYTTSLLTPSVVERSDKFSNTEWIWSRDRWGDWQHTASWSGSESGTNSEYGPIIVDDHGEHGTNTNLNGGSTQSSVWRTFTDPSGIGWNTLEFTGVLTATDMLNGRWMTIDVNDQQIFRGTAAQNPPGNNVKFTIKRSFPPSSSVKVKISNGQTPAWRPLFAMKYYSVKLSRET